MFDDDGFAIGRQFLDDAFDLKSFLAIGCLTRGQQEKKKGKIKLNGTRTYLGRRLKASSFACKAMEDEKESFPASPCFSLFWFVLPCFALSWLDFWRFFWPAKNGRETISEIGAVRSR